MCRTVHAILQTVICGVQMLVRVFMTIILMIENLVRMILQTLYNFLSFMLQMISLVPICVVFLLTARLKCFMCGGGGPCPVNRGGTCDCLMSAMAIVILFLIFRATGVLDKIFYKIGYVKARPLAFTRFVPTPGDVTECSRNDSFYDYGNSTNLTTILMKAYEEDSGEEGGEDDDTAEDVESEEDKSEEEGEGEEEEEKDKSKEAGDELLTQVTTIVEDTEILTEIVTEMIKLTNTDTTAHTLGNRAKRMSSQRTKRMKRNSKVTKPIVNEDSTETLTEFELEESANRNMMTTVSMKADKARKFSLVFAGKKGKSHRKATEPTNNLTTVLYYLVG